MITITLQIGNSDDKLSQERWSEYVRDIGCHECQPHFFACSEGSQKWQNAAWVVTCHETEAVLLKGAVLEVRKMYEQDSVAWTEGATEFV